MRILILTQWFDPEPNNMKALAFADGLRKKGHRVEVLTGIPNYPTGNIYKDYRLKLYQKEWMKGIAIHRVLLYPSHDSNSVKRMANYISFSIFASLIGPLVIKGKIDVIYVYHPPATTMLPAMLLSKIKRAKILLDINDLWPDSILSVGMMNNRLLLYLLNQWMSAIYKSADRITVLSEGIKKILETRNVNTNKVNVIPVWCNELLLTSDKNTAFKEQYKLNNCFLGIYAGAMGKAQNLATLIKVADKLSAIIPEFRLVLIGHGNCIDELKELVLKKELTNVVFIPIMPTYDLTMILNQADFLLLHLKKDPLFSVTIPSKIPYYLAIGKPIVAGVKGNAAQIIKDSNGGIVCAPDNVDSIAAGIIKLYNMNNAMRNRMADKGRTYYYKNLSMKKGINSFDKLLRELRVKS